MPFRVQHNSFNVNHFILALSEVDIVPGVQWLKQLGLVLTNYTTRTMVFSYLGHQVHLQADVPLRLSNTSTHRIKRLAQTQSISAMFHLSRIPNRPNRSSLLPCSSTFAHHQNSPPFFSISTNCFRNPMHYHLHVPLPTVSTFCHTPTLSTSVPIATHISKRLNQRNRWPLCQTPNSSN